MTKQNESPATLSLPLTLTLRRTWPDGGAAYTVDGLEGTIYVKKGILAGEAPQSLTLTGSGLADPVAVAAERAARAEARAKAKAEADAAAAAAAEQPAAEPVAPKPEAPVAAPQAAKPGRKKAKAA